MMKNGNLLYLFDFDGTLVGDGDWKGFFRNTYSCLRYKVRINPSRFDIRWSILTGRPRIDLSIIKFVCLCQALKPEEIFTAPTLFYNYKNNEENYRDKHKLIKNILDGKTRLKYSKFPIDKIIYVDNDFDCIKFLNGNREQYRYLAIPVKDFLENKLTGILL